ncbi:hypothetical protein BDN72DRAFT_599062 [Pluteus cervinus]|uniref:Uncharacterized protein n=1 Tax=Pluteus cervinus TaxID=181527 RepID=A0ACD3BA72_9AGAR|nr:hypothetical protein BDN72DRAFT_599062 [Pluteus cervinus]
MSSQRASSLDGFDPFAVHPFTNCSGGTAQNASPLEANPIPDVIQAPQPRASLDGQQAARPRQIFQPYQRDTLTPDLNDVLKKAPKTFTEPPSNIAPDSGLSHVDSPRSTSSQVEP